MEPINSHLSTISTTLVIRLVVGGLLKDNQLLHRTVSNAQVQKYYVKIKKIILLLFNVRSADISFEFSDVEFCAYHLILLHTQMSKFCSGNVIFFLFFYQKLSLQTDTSVVLS